MNLIDEFLCCWLTVSCLLTLLLSLQHYIKLSEPEKNRKLTDLLDALDFNQVVIFVKSVSRAAELNKLLTDCNFPSICIHSGMPQEERYAFHHFGLHWMCRCQALFLYYWKPVATIHHKGLVFTLFLPAG